MFVSATLDAVARIYHRDGKLHKDLVGHKGPVLHVKFNPDGRHVISASVDGTCRLWDTLSGEQLRFYENHRGPLMEAAWRNTETFVTAGVDGKIVLQSVQYTAPIKIFRGHAVFIFCAIEAVNLAISDVMVVVGYQ